MKTKILLLLIIPLMFISCGRTKQDLYKEGYIYSVKFKDSEILTKEMPIIDSLGCIQIDGVSANSCGCGDPDTYTGTICGEKFEIQELQYKESRKKRK